MFKYVPLIIALSVMIFSGCDNPAIYNRSDSLTNLPVIEVYIDEDEYYNLLQTKTTETEIPAKIIYNNESGTGYIRSSGGGSRMHPRWSYRIELKSGLNIAGLKSFSLSSQTYDPTMIHTTVVSRLYAMRGVPVFDNQHVFLKINNQDKGLYLLIERIDEDFFQIRNIPTYEIYKAEFDSDFSLSGPEHPLFSYDKKLPDDNNYAHLLDFINTIETCGISTIEQSLEPYIDIDNYLQYHAMSTVINNDDAFKNNYYLQRETPVSPYKIYPWDFDRSFDPDNDVGLAGENNLFLKLSQNTTVRSKYINEMQFILNNYFREDILFPVIDSTAAHIRQAYNMDPFLGAGRYDLDTQVGALKAFITSRRQFLLDNIGDY